MDVQIKRSIEIINFIIKDLKLDNAKKLSESLGFSRPERIYKILRGDVSISKNLAKIINEKYSQYSIEWLRGGDKKDLKRDRRSKTDNESNLLTEKEVLFVIESLHKHIEQLEKYDIFNNWVNAQVEERLKK